ncbi:MAG TPA: PEP-CTERM sorting domain-containing protein [Sedimenticola sp.]|nr:PEP-CTERM sorting domain-containing protein [Sedimenticola sp.]
MNSWPYHNRQLGLTNDGLIEATTATPLTIRPNASGLTNNGTLRVNAGSTLIVTGAANSFTNFSTATSTLTGGEYQVAGTLKFDNANIVTNAADIVLDGVASRIVNQANSDALAGFATNSSAGSFTIQNGRNFTTAGGFINGGNMNVGTGSTFTAIEDYTQTAGFTYVDGTLEALGVLDIQGGGIGGSGDILGSIISSGIVSPGSSPGTLEIIGDYTQTASAVLGIEIGGYIADLEFDQLLVSGTAFLDGIFAVSLINDFLPAVGDFFEIMSFSSFDGEFASFTGMDIGNGLFFEPIYDSTSFGLLVHGSQQVPEPRTILLFFLGLIMYCFVFPGDRKLWAKG